GSNISLFVKNQTKIVKQTVFKQLKEIVKKGKLNAYNSDTLLIEQVSVILYFYYKKLNYNFSIDEYYLPRFKSIYPIDLNDLKQRINKFKLTEFYKRKHIEQHLIKEIIENALEDNHE